MIKSMLGSGGRVFKKDNYLAFDPESRESGPRRSEVELVRMSGPLRSFLEKSGHLTLTYCYDIEK